MERFVVTSVYYKYGEYSVENLDISTISGYLIDYFNRYLDISDSYLRKYGSQLPFHDDQSIRTFIFSTPFDVVAKTAINCGKVIIEEEAGSGIISIIVNPAFSFY